MENLSNNNVLSSLPYSSLRGGGTTTKQSNNNSNSLWLFLLFFSFFIFHSSFAQQGYKKLFTNSATASVFQSVVPQGHSNSMVMTIVNDSMDAKQGIRISRIDANGNMQASAYYNTAQYPKTFIYPNWHNACRIHDNLFVFSGTGGDSTCGQPGFILTADSNGLVQKFQSIKPAACGSSDCFMWSAQVRYDSVRQQIIFGGHTKCSTGMKPYLLKFDTSLALVWSKIYPSFVYPTTGINNLILDKDKYVLCGLADNGYESNNKLWDTKSVMLAIDTGGTMRWVYTSPASEMRGAVVNAISTPDGGYVYCTMGLGYNRRPTTSPTADFYGKQMIVKLDATLKEEWVKVLNTSYSSFSPLININLLKCDDTSFYYHGFKSDSIAPNDNETKNILCKYKMDGTEIWRRFLTTVEPTDTLVGQLYDIAQMQDKSIVLVGMTDNPVLISPTQRGFTIRVDSNGCMGDMDPQCDPLSIPPVIVAGAGFKVYPNPSTGVFTIVCPPSFGGAEDGIIIYDITGRKLIQQELNQAETKLDMSQYASGVYWYIIRQGDKTISNGKLIKQ